MCIRDSKSNRWEECAQMPAKMARSAPRPSSGLPEAMIAFRTSLLSCRKPGKPRIFKRVWESSGGIPVEIVGREIAAHLERFDKNRATPIGHEGNRECIDHP